jgi:DNA-binding response OmpR family regulator
MIRLLILDLDALLVAVIGRALLREGIAVEAVESVRAARERIARGDIDVALLDASLLHRADFAQLNGVPLVLTTSFPEPESVRQFTREARLLRKPFTGAELTAALREALGPLDSEPLSLVDLLLRAHTSGLSVAFRIGAAEVFMERGELVHARLGALAGEAALAAILADSNHEPRSMPSRGVAQTIRRPFRTVLLDALGAVDAREQMCPLPTPFPTSPSRRGGPKS